MKNPNCLFFHHRGKIYIYKRNAAHIPRIKYFRLCLISFFMQRFRNEVGIWISRECDYTHGNDDAYFKYFPRFRIIRCMQADKTCRDNIIRYEKIFPVIFLLFLWFRSF